MDAFDAWLEYRRETSQTGSLPGVGQGNLPKGTFTVSQYLDHQRARYQTIGGPLEGAEKPVQLSIELEVPALGNTLDGSLQLPLPMTAIESSETLKERLEQTREKRKLHHQTSPAPPKYWDRPHLTPIRENAYRILGLPGDVDYPAIQQRGDALRLQLRLGKPIQTEWDMDWAWPVERTEATIQEALWRLSDPVLRLRERLYWFTGKQGKPVVQYADTPERFGAGLSDVKGIPGLKHDVALYFLMQSAQINLRDSLNAWKTSLFYWHKLMEDDAFWEDLSRQESRGRFMQAATHHDIEQIRKTFLLHVTEGLVSRARQALMDEEDADLKVIMNSFKEIKLPPGLNAQVECAIFGLLKTSLEQLYDKVLAENYKNDALAIFKKDLLPLYERLAKHLEPKSLLLAQIRETIVQCIYRIFTLWVWETDEPDYKLLRSHARRIAPCDSLVLPRIELLEKGKIHG